MQLLQKHIDLVDRRIIKGEKIPHEEKIFSIFETYTEWVKKGKARPNVALGKKLSITTDQFNLIVDYQIMDDEQDRDIVILLADRLYQFWFIMSRKIVNLKLVNADIVIKEQAERSESMRHFIT